MIRKGLIERLYDAASIQRWNDHIRPVEFTELDKQAHKMIIAYVIAKFNETDRGAKIDWVKLIEGAIFEFLQRVILTDIKPPVFHQMMKYKGDEINRWVLEKTQADLNNGNLNFADNFKKYLLDNAYSTTEKRILRAAHYLATNWEFKIIYNAAPFIHGIDRTKEEIENEIEEHYDLIGVQRLSLGKKSFGFIDLCGQLRFQQRWAQSPRIPKTSVLGHMLVVAILTYLCSCEIKACERGKYNNFFGALFHDLPEVLTRDIVSPVKKSIPGLGNIIEEYEKIQVENRILPLLPVSWHEEMRYYVENGFTNRIRLNGKVKSEIPDKEMNLKYNKNNFSPLSGELIKVCDDLSAYIEASLSIGCGIKSHFLEDARTVYKKHQNTKIAGVNFGYLFDYFKY